MQPLSEDPVELPRYSVPEAARYLRMAESTLKSWVAGRTYSVRHGEKLWAGLINRPSETDPRLSYSNLIEAHVLKAIRRVYRVKMPAVRTALDYARETLGVERVLLSRNLRLTNGNVFLDHMGKLINVGKGGQGAMPEILEQYLRRIRWDELTGAPVEYFPWTRTPELLSPQLITILPVVAFGRPIVGSKAITTAIISERFNAGESITELAEDYDIQVLEVEEALRYERLELAA